MMPWFDLYSRGIQLDLYLGAPVVIAGESNLKVEFYINGEWSGGFSNGRASSTTSCGYVIAPQFEIL